MRSHLARLGALFAAGALVAACGTTEPAPAPGPTGSLVAAFGFDGPQHDVAFMGYAIYAGEVDCADPGDAEPVAGATVPLEEEFLPPWLEQDGSGGDMHPFADSLFVLQPGVYTACATPLTDALEPSEHCAAASGVATVMPEMTTEVVLYAQCLGDPTGALDVVVALNDPPHISGLVIEPSKFITVCEEATFTVTASDPNGDALFYDWFAYDQGGAIAWSASGTNPFASLAPPGPGEWTIQVVVSDGHGGTASLTFPLHVSDADCGEPEPFCGDDVCDGNLGEDCQTCAADCGPCEPEPFCGDDVCDGNLGEDCQTCPVDCGPCGQCVPGIVTDPADVEGSLQTSFDEVPLFTQAPFAAGGVGFLPAIPPPLLAALPPGYPPFADGSITTGAAIPGMDGDPFVVSFGSPIVMQVPPGVTSFGFAWGAQSFGFGSAATVRVLLSDGTVVEHYEPLPPDFGFLGLNTCDPGQTIDYVMVGGPLDADGTSWFMPDFGVDDLYHDGP